MLKQFAAALVCASTLALLIGVIYYEPRAGSNILQVQHTWGKKSCPSGQRWNQYKQMCE